MAMDHDYWVVFDLTSDAGGDASETRSIKGIISAFYVKRSAADAGLDLTITGEVADFSMPIVAETDDNSDGWLTTFDVTPFPAGGDITVTIAGAGNAKNVKVVALVT